jgi:hypothetical protein
MTWSENEMKRLKLFKITSVTELMQSDYLIYCSLYPINTIKSSNYFFNFYTMVRCSNYYNNIYISADS